MDWRIFTLINAIIALITLIAVAFDIEAHRRTERRTSEPKSDTSRSAADNRRHSGHRSINNFADLRVDKLDSVPPSEFYELFLSATPEEMNALTMKFNELPPNVRTAGGIGMFFQAWAELDGKAALLGAFKLKDLDLKRMAVDAVVHSVSPGIASELAAYLNENPHKDLADVQSRFMDALLERWSGTDPPAAAKFLDHLNDSHSELVGTAAKVAFAWGNVDPVGALAWVEKANHKEISEYLFVQVIKGWSRSDSAAAGAYVAQHADNPGAKAAAAAMTEQLARNDPNVAVSWISTLPRGEAKAEAEERLAMLWGEKDPATAAHWVETLPKEEQVSVVSQLASAWAAQDWASTRRWIATLPTGVRDGAISAAISGARNNVTRTEALPLAMSISDQTQRMSTIEQIIREWAESDASAAQAWIRGSGLRQREKQELTALLSERPASEGEERKPAVGYIP